MPMISQMALPGLETNSSDFKRLLLLSLQPEYWQVILEGKKKDEYRRSFRSDAVRAYIYLSSPRKEVAGLIDFGVPIIDDPQEIADVAERDAPGSWRRIMHYLESKKAAFAIPTFSYEEVPRISLAELRSRFGFVAPQGCLVLDNHTELRDFIRARHLDGYNGQTKSSGT